jgi:hypothetical protein
MSEKEREDCHGWVVGNDVDKNTKENIEKLNIQLFGDVLTTMRREQRTCMDKDA